MKRKILNVGDRVSVCGRIGEITEVYATRTGVTYTVLHSAENSGWLSGGEAIPSLWSGPDIMVRRAPKPATRRRKAIP